MHLFSVGIRISLQLYSVSSILCKFCVILAEYIKSSNVIAKVKLKCDELVRQTNSYTSYCCYCLDTWVLKLSSCLKFECTDLMR